LLNTIGNYYILNTVCVCILIILQEGFTPFQYAVKKERSKVVKYFIEEAKVDATSCDEVSR